MVVGLVVGQLRETGLKEVANPPYTQPERDQGVGTERSVYLFDGCSHTAAKVAKFIGFAPPGPQREVHADSFCEKSPHEGGRGIFFPRRPPSAVLFTICSLIGAPNDWDDPRSCKLRCAPHTLRATVHRTGRRAEGASQKTCLTDIRHPLSGYRAVQQLCFTLIFLVKPCFSGGRPPAKAGFIA